MILAKVFDMPFDPDTLTYNDAGLIPAIAQDASSGEVLMMAWMNAAAVAKTLATGQVTYWSRSRQEFWVKGATSGNTQTLVDFRLDCDRDCLLLEVKQNGLLSPVIREITTWPGWILFQTQMRL